MTVMVDVVKDDKRLIIEKFTPQEKGLLKNKASELIDELEGFNVLQILYVLDVMRSTLLEQYGVRTIQFKNVKHDEHDQHD